MIGPEEYLEICAKVEKSALINYRDLAILSSLWKFGWLSTVQVSKRVGSHPQIHTQMIKLSSMSLIERAEQKPEKTKKINVYRITNEGIQKLKHFFPGAYEH